MFSVFPTMTMTMTITTSSYIIYRRKVDESISKHTKHNQKILSWNTTSNQKTINNNDDDVDKKSGTSNNDIVSVRPFVRPLNG